MPLESCIIRETGSGRQSGGPSYKIFAISLANSPGQIDRRQRLGGGALIADLIPYFPLNMVSYMCNSELLRQQFFDMLYTATVRSGSNGDNCQLILIRYNDLTTSVLDQIGKSMHMLLCLHGR